MRTTTLPIGEVLPESARVFFRRRLQEFAGLYDDCAHTGPRRRAGDLVDRRPQPEPRDRRADSQRSGRERRRCRRPGHAIDRHQRDHSARASWPARLENPFASPYRQQSGLCRLLAHRNVQRGRCRLASSCDRWLALADWTGRRRRRRPGRVAQALFFIFRNRRDRRDLFFDRYFGAGRIPRHDGPAIERSRRNHGRGRSRRPVSGLERTCGHPAPAVAGAQCFGRLKNSSR